MKHKGKDSKDIDLCVKQLQMTLKVTSGTMNFKMYVFINVIDNLKFDIKTKNQTMPQH